jgi:small-conductance mechanosensitive channel
MPDMQTAMQDLGTWLAANAIAVAVIFVLLLVGFRGARPFIHNVLVRAIKAQQATIGDGETEDLETERRVATIEDLLNKLIRFGVTAGIVAVILGIFDLWSVLASFGIVVAALAFAGQAIILDYIMGVLILTEGQYFKGDVVSVNLVEGTVEEVGVRRTLIRDPRGTLHSVSNGLIRQSANFTRTYAAATIDIDGVADKDVETVIAILDEVGAALVADETIGPLLRDTPGYAATIRLSSNGATLRFAGRVRPEARPQVEAEARRRIAAAMGASGVQLIRSADLRPPA